MFNAQKQNHTKSEHECKAGRILEQGELKPNNKSKIHRAKQSPNSKGDRNNTERKSTRQWELIQTDEDKLATKEVKTGLNRLGRGR